MWVVGLILVIVALFIEDPWRRALFIIGLVLIAVDLLLPLLLAAGNDVDAEALALWMR